MTLAPPPMTADAPSQPLHLYRETEIDAPVETVFEALLEQLDAGFDLPDGKTMPMKLERWPGGRWYRDLGDNAGHFWGHVQVIKPPGLLEITGPLFMSMPVLSHVQYRLKAEGNATRLCFTHRAAGDVPAEVRLNVGKGWEHQLQRIAGRVRK